MVELETLSVPRWSQWQVAAAVLVVVVLGLVAYVNCLDNPLIIDDRILIEDDPRVQEGLYLELVTGEYWPGARGNRLYRPLTSLSLALNWACCPSPRGLRLPNLILHLGCGLLVLLLTLRLTRSLAGAAAAGALFVVHPVHSGVLNSVVDRAEIGAALFGLLTVMLLWPAPQQDRGGGPRPRVVLAAATTFAVALLFKENAITIVGVVVLAHLCCGGRSAGRAAPASARPRSDGDGEAEAAAAARRGPRWLSGQLLWGLLALLVVAGGYLVLRAAVLEAVTRPAGEIAVVDNIIAHPAHGLGAGDSALLARWGTPLAVFGTAVRLLLVPHPLSWDYSYAAIDSVRGLGDLRLLFGALCLLAVGAAIAGSLARRRRVAFALGLLVITYAVVSNTFVVIGTIFAERYLYLPSVGLCVVVGVLTADAVPALRAVGRGQAREWAGFLLVAVGVVAVTFAGLTIRRNRDFVSEATLNRVDVRTNPRSCRLLTAVAADLYAAGDFDAAVEQVTRAIEICPEFTTAWRVSGLANWRRGRSQEALRQLQRAVQLGASHSEQVAVAIADIHKNGGDYRTAIAVLEAFIRRDTARTAAAARNNLAWYLITARPPELRDPIRALPMARQAVEIDPGQPDDIDTLVSVLVASDRHDEAVATLRELLSTVDPGHPQRQGLVDRLEVLERRPAEPATRP
jgi:hypothetical protein